MPRGWIIAVAGAILALILGLAPTSARAQAGVVGTPVTLCIVRAAPGMTAPALFAHPERFDCRTPQVDYGPGDYWALSAPLPPQTARNWPGHVRFASLWQGHVTLFARYDDSAIRRYALDTRSTSRRIQLGAIIEQPLDVRDVGVARLLWHVEGSANMRGIVNGATIARPSESAQSNLVLGAIYSAFAGLCVALLVYNLALWAAMRHRFQFAYCVMVAALLLYAFSSSGALAWALPDIDNNFRMRINYVMLAVSGAAALGFARSFFEARVFDGWLRRASSVVVSALLASSILFVTLAPWSIARLDRLYALSFVLLMAAALAVLFRAWQQRSNFLWLFAIAWAAPIALATVRVTSNFGVVGWNFWVDNSTIIAMALEALLSSLAIAYRIRLLSRDRDEAREQEMAARLLADIDPLTGLLNRRAFLREAIGRPGEQCLMLADIDHFKRINETLGHDGGDEVLRIVARALRNAVPPGGLLARVGGEEFAILVGAWSPLRPAAVLDHIRAERMPFDVAVTASIGACVGEMANERDWKALYRGADRALFDAKAAGRDRARMAA